MIQTVSVLKTWCLEYSGIRTDESSGKVRTAHQFIREAKVDDTLWGILIMYTHKGSRKVFKNGSLGKSRRRRIDNIKMDL